MKIVLRYILISSLLVSALVSVQTYAAEKLKVVYHVSELEKVPFVLTNIKNHINGVGGAENVEIVLVTHGPSAKAFHNDNVKEKVSSMVDELQIEGVAFNMCGVTMGKLDYKLDDVLPGFVRRDEGGVVRIAELQSKGYLYIRP